MRTSEKTDILVESLVLAQKDFKHPVKNLLAKGKSFSYKYAGLPQVIECVKDDLFTHGFCFSQAMSVDASFMILTTRLWHKSGQWIESDYYLPILDNPQDMGSQITYARRYALVSILGIAADEDDDANTVVEGDSKKKYNRNIVIEEVTAILMTEDAKMIRDWLPPGTTRPEAKRRIMDVVDVTLAAQEITTPELLGDCKAVIAKAIKERN